MTSRPEIFSIKLEATNGSSPSAPVTDTAAATSVVSPGKSSTTGPANHHAYFPDSTIQGNLYLKMKQNVRVKSLKVQLYGIEYVRFVQAPPSKSKQKKKKIISSKKASKKAEGQSSHAAGEPDETTPLRKQEIEAAAAAAAAATDKDGKQQPEALVIPHEHTHHHHHGGDEPGTSQAETIGPSGSNATSNATSPAKSNKSNHHHHSAGVHHHHQHHPNGSITFSESHVIVDSQLVFLGPKGGASSTSDYPEVATGSHVYSFGFKLPHTNLPSSFEGDYGCVRYFLKATLELLPTTAGAPPLPFTTFQPLTIVSGHPTFLPSFLLPQKQEDEQSICSTFFCCCCVEGTIFCEVESPRQAYCPGQDIHMKIRIMNSSGRDIAGFTLRLVRDVRYLAEGHQRSELGQRVTDTVVETRIRSNRELHDFDLNLALPKSTCTSTCHTSHLISIDYSVQVLVHSVGVEHPLKYNFPILIGSVSDSNFDIWAQSLKSAKVSAESEFNTLPPSGGEKNSSLTQSVYDRRFTEPVAFIRDSPEASSSFPDTLALYDASQEVSNMTANLFNHQYI